MNWLKVLTKTGRQSLVREAARAYLTREKVAELASDGVSRLLAQACEGIPEARMQKVCGYCRDGATLFAAVADAVADKVVTTDEAAEICAQVARLTGEVVTQERVDAVVENIVARVP